MKGSSPRLRHAFHWQVARTHITNTWIFAFAFHKNNGGNNGIHSSVLCCTNMRTSRHRGSTPVFFSLSCLQTTSVQVIDYKKMCSRPVRQEFSRWRTRTNIRKTNKCCAINKNLYTRTHTHTPVMYSLPQVHTQALLILSNVHGSVAEIFETSIQWEYWKLIWHQ